MHAIVERSYAWATPLLVVIAQLAISGASSSPTLERTFSLGGENGGTGVRMISPDGTRVISYGKHGAIVREARGGRQLFWLDLNDEMLWDADWSGERIATITDHGKAMIWDAQTGALLHERSMGRHSDFIELAPDGRVLTTGDHVLELWSPDGATTVFPTTYLVTHTALSPDGSQLAAADYDCVKIWDTTTGVERARFAAGGNGDDAVLYVKWLPDNRLVTVDWTRVVIWDVTTQTPLRVIESSDRPWYVQATPDGETLFVGYYSETSLVRAYATATGTAIREFSLDGILSRMALAGDLLITTSGPDEGGLADKTTRVWDTRTGELVRTLGPVDQTASFAVSADGTLIGVNGDDDAQVFALRTGERLAHLGSHTAGITALAFARGGRVFATGSGRLLGRDYTAKIWDGCSGVMLGAVRHESVVNTVDISPDGTRLVTGSNDWTIAIWDTTTFELLRTSAHLCDVNSARFSPTGDTIVSASCDGTVRVWDVERGTPRFKLSMDGGVRDARYSPDGATIVASNTRGEVRVWNARDGKVRYTRDVCDDWADKVELDHSGTNMLVSCGEVSALFDVATGTELHRFDGGTAQLSPDGTHVLAKDALHAFVFSAASGQRVATIEVVEDWIDSWTMAWTPDGTRIVTGDREARVKLWDARTAALLTTVDAPPGQVWGLVFDPVEPSRLVIYGEDGEDQNAGGALQIWRYVPN